MALSDLLELSVKACSISLLVTSSSFVVSSSTQSLWAAESYFSRCFLFWSMRAGQGDVFRFSELPEEVDSSLPVPQVISETFELLVWGYDNSDEERFTGEQWDSGTKSLSLSVKLMLSMDSKLART